VLDPSLSIEPEAEAGRIYALVLVEEVITLARQGDITRFEKGLVELNESVALAPDAVTAGSWNSLCWSGALYGYAAQVLDACETAVRMAPESGGIRDSRGLAYALTGNIAGAIEDFEFFITWSEETGRGRNIDWRKEWVAALKANQNPFDAAMLEQLRNE
jgi:hypothetical protein